MKREVERELKLPAFDLSLAELELLVQRITEIFDSEASLRSVIKLTLPSERLQFESIEELKAYGRVRGRVTRFTVEFSQGARELAIKTGGLLSSTPIVRAEAENEVWCAGAIDIVRSAVQQNRAWYWWFVNLPFTFLFFLLSTGPWLASWFTSAKFAALPPKVALTWFAAVILLGFLSFSKEKLLPPAAITFSNDLSFIRRYGAEISLVLGVVSILLGVLSLL